MIIAEKESINWEYIGAVLANMTDEDQAKFFKAFVKEVKTWGTYYQVEYQMASISQLLTDNEKEILSGISYRENDND